MRTTIVALAILWIGCGPTNRDDGGEDATVIPDACEGLRCAVVDCAKTGRPETTLSGTVFAPNGTLPLFGVTVYVPNRDPGFFTDGAQCAKCTDQIPGDPIASTQSDTQGRFVLSGVPIGENIPLIITIGKWRRQIRIPVVSECTDTALLPSETSLPRRKLEGEMPKIAMATGGCDALECLARKLGIADSEFTNDAGDGRVHLFDAGGADRTATGMVFAPATTLWGSLDKLKQYDLVMFSCECSVTAGNKPPAALDALMEYANLGGRAFLSHYHSYWVTSRWPAIATCASNIFPTDPSTGIIDQVSNPKGSAFASWMVSVGGSTTLGQLQISQPRQTCTSLDASEAERWVYLQNGTEEQIQNFQFTTPNNVAKEDRCGKVVFSDMHVASGSTSSSPFPNGCSSAALTPQEKALAFMFFDIASCIGPIF